MIENVGGAGGTIGSGRVAAATPDGYTLLAGSMGSHVAAPVLTPNVKYDSERDFIPIGPTAHSPAVIVARKDFPAKDFREFVADCQRAAATASSRRMAASARRRTWRACCSPSAIGAKPTLVAYRGTGPAMNDLIGGHVDFFCEQSVSVDRAGRSPARSRPTRCRPRERLASLPDVPTAKEVGHRLSDEHLGRHLRAEGHAGAGRRKARGRARQGAGRRRACRQRINDLGGSIPGKAERTPAAFDAYVKAEIARWAPVLKAAAEPGNKSARTRRPLLS